MIISKYIPVKIKKKTKRMGRGISSGQGKSCGRGQKGQKAHGKLPRPGFEGGQTQIYRRLPKVGRQHNLRPRSVLKAINLADIEDSYQFVENQILDFSNQKVKVLSKGEAPSKKITIKAKAFSYKAKQKIEQAGSK